MDGRTTSPNCRKASLLKIIRYVCMHIIFLTKHGYLKSQLIYLYQGGRGHQAVYYTSKFPFAQQLWALL